MAQTGRPPKVLVVDGDLRTAKVLGLLLRGDGFEVDVVSDWLGASVRFSRPPPPDALICAAWPGHVDDDAALLARARNPELPVFVLTTRPEQRWQALIGPAVQVITKPIDYPTFLADLRAALGWRSRR
jgi:DNA-binding response OmpR family regulator